MSLAGGCHEHACEQGPRFGARGLGVQRGGRAVLEGIDFALDPGELLELRGPNGSGKSSLLRVLCALMPPAAGELRWRGEPVRAGDARFQRASAYLGHADGIDADLGVAENLHFAARLAGQEASAAQVDAALSQVGLAGAGPLAVRSLSQGQRRRIALARLALRRCDLWLLDEPHSGLDAQAATQFDGLLRAHLDGGGIAVVATHHALDLQGRTLRLDA